MPADHIPSPDSRARMLRRALAANAVFSALSGLCFALWPATVESSLGYTGPEHVIRYVGIGLVGFAMQLCYDATRSQPDTRSALAASLGDFAWVLGTVALYLLKPGLFSSVGWALAGVIATFVMAFGAGQVLGIRALVHPDGQAPGVVQLRHAQLISGVPRRAWEVLSDVDGYAKYAPSLQSSEILEGRGVGMVRRCSDSRGSWTEACTGWRPGADYQFRVETGAASYPYPFRELEGNWALRSAVDGLVIAEAEFDQPNTPMEISIELRAQMPWGVLGELAFAMMLTPARVSLMGLFDNWAAVITDEEGSDCNHD